MGPKKREADPSVRTSLFKEFYRFSFFKAVQLIERSNPTKKPLGKALTPREEPVRFFVKPGLKFPPSDISNLSPSDENEPVAMEVAFLGLIGPSGILPYWYNELALERARHKDFSMAAFFDLFHHRLLSHFYLAWKKYRLTEAYLPGARDRISRCFLSLIGLGTPGLSGKIGLPEEPLLFYSGLFCRSVPSRVAIEAAVEYFSETKAEVKQFINRIVSIDLEDQTQLGSANGSLGVDTVCGSYAWECQTKFRVHLGPMRWQGFLSFLPTGKRLRPAYSLIRYMVGIEYEFEIGLILMREEVPPCALGMKAPAPPRLGWSTWVKTPGITPEEDPCVVLREPEIYQRELRS